MFIVVRSGDGEERLFNLNCQVDALLRDIYHRCPYDVENDDYTLDLMDEEGRALSIYTRKGTSLGTDCLTERGCYLLVLVKTDPKGRKYYEPLIENLDDHYPDLKDVFGVDALDGRRQPNAKNRKKSTRQNSAERQAAAAPFAAMAAMNSLKMKSKLRKLKK
eukprot:sb/3472783/